MFISAGPLLTCLEQIGMTMTIVWLGLIAVVSAIAGFLIGRLKFKGVFGNVFHLNDLRVEIGSSAEQIASVSQEIAKSSTEQLDTLNTTVSAAHEIRSMIEKTTESTESLLSQTEDLKRSVSAGNQVVGKMVSSSGDIKQSMDHFQNEMRDSISELREALKVIQEIASKTQVIGEIVFQTKLLSFNASVEAARAGDAGKGFAVVAEEVGKLAQMSGAAANEISDIVTRSLETADRAVNSTAEKIETLAKATIAKADLGFSDARECEEIFNLMESKISFTVDTLKGISAAAKEEADGVAQLDDSMSKFQESTDRNRLIASQATQHSIGFEKLTRQLGQVTDDWLRKAGHNPAQVKNYKRFIWNDRLELHVHEMDEEHKVLVGKINTLIERLEIHNRNPDLHSVRDAFSALAAYTVKHFADEEQFMESISYPQLNSHKRIHKKLLEQVTAYGNDLSKGQLDDTKLISFLSNWLISHIMGVDMQYAETVNKKGAHRSTHRHSA